LQHPHQADCHSGTLKFNSLLEWLQSYAPNTTSEKSKTKSKSKEAPAKKAQPLKRKASPVEEAKAVPAEGVQETAQGESGEEAAEPEVPAAPGTSDGDDEPLETGLTHEEL
jgi:hypothetical protein